jgi:hypothetical protein
MVLLECPMEFARECIHDPRTTVPLVPATDSVVFDSTADERAAM